VKSRTTPRFRELLAALPEHIQRQARVAHARFVEDPDHPGLNFKRVHSTIPMYSVRIGRNYRAIGLWEGDEIRWVWIGSHADYDKFLRES
jgi:hypothetical protein